MNEALRKAAYYYVSEMIGVDTDLEVENPELVVEILKIKATLKAASEVPPLEGPEVPF